MGGYAQAVAQKSAMDMLQRNFLASQYDNVINAPLPDQQKDPEAYQKALDAKAKALEARQKVYSPDHHANLFDAIHGLITGRQEGAQTQSGAPVSSATPQAPGAPPAANGDLSTQHPMTPLPAGHPLNKFQEGIDALGRHLKAAAHPIAPKPGPDWMSLAAAPSPDEVKQARDLALERQKEASALAVANARRPRGSVNQQRYDALARGMGLSGYDDPNITPEQADAIANKVREESLAPKFLTDPKTGYVSRVVYDAQGNATTEPLLDKNGKPFGGFKPDKVTIRNGYYTYTNDLTGEVVQVPVTTETRQVFGPNVPEDKTPISSASPKVPSSDSTANSDALNKKLNGKRSQSRKIPVSSTSPQVPTGTRVIGNKPTLADKSDAAQYTKVAEDANNKRQAYESARRALASGSTPSSDQELIYSWVRSNVQGAGRMTQAEFKQAASVGSLPQRAQNWYNLTLKGTLAPSIEQMMLADIKRSSEVADAEAADLRGKLTKPQSSTSPQVPGSDDLRERLLKAVQ